MHRDEDVGWLDVAMNDPFLMSVLNRLAHLNEKREPVRNTHPTLSTVLRHPDTADQLHYEIGSPLERRASIEYLRDVWMIEERQDLTLRFKPCDHSLRIHPWLDDFQCDLASDGSRLISKVGDTAAAFAQLSD